MVTAEVPRFKYYFAIECVHIFINDNSKRKEIFNFSDSLQPPEAPVFQGTLRLENGDFRMLLEMQQCIVAQNDAVISDKTS